MEQYKVPMVVRSADKKRFITVNVEKDILDEAERNIITAVDHPNYDPFEAPTFIKVPPPPAQYKKRPYTPASLKDPCSDRLRDPLGGAKRARTASSSASSGLGRGLTAGDGPLERSAPTPRSQHGEADITEPDQYVGK